MIPKLNNSSHKVSRSYQNHVCIFTLLRSERPKLYTILAFLSALGLTYTVDEICQINLSAMFSDYKIVHEILHNKFLATYSEKIQHTADFSKLIQSIFEAQKSSFVDLSLWHSERPKLHTIWPF